MENMLLKSGDRYSQRNNSYMPYSACMPTTFVMWCIASGFKDIETLCPLNEVPDNWCMKLLNTPDAMDFAAKKYSDLIKQNYTPNEIHGMYHSYLEPLIFGKVISDFIYAGNDDGQGFNFDEYMDIIKQGIPLWTSGAYQGTKAPIDGHANLFCGVIGEYLRNVDPYGNFHFNYKDDSGYDVRYTRQEFNDHIKPLGSKRKNAHILRGFKL